MREDNQKIRMTVQHTAKNQMSGGNCGVKRKGNQIGQRVGLQSLSAEVRRQRMKKDRETEDFDPRENGLEKGIVEIVAFNVGPHVNAAYSGQLAHTVEFLNGAVGIEHGKRRQDDEPVRIGLMCRD